MRYKFNIGADSTALMYAKQYAMLQTRPWFIAHLLTLYNGHEMSKHYTVYSIKLLFFNQYNISV